MAAKPAPIEPERYFRLKEEFRQNPGSINRVSKATNVPYNVAKRAWETGWPLQKLPAIGAALNEEHLRTRAALWDAEVQKAKAEAKREAEDRLTEIRQDALGLITDAERRARRITDDAQARATSQLEQTALEAKARMQEIMDSAKVDSARSAAIEIEMVRNARDLSRAMAAFLKEVWTADAIPLIAQMVTRILQGTDVKASDAAMLLRSLSGFGADAVKIGQLAFEMERQRLGKPIHIIGHQEVEGTLEDAEKLHKETSSLLEAVRRGKAPKAGEPAPGGTNGVH